MNKWTLVQIIDTVYAASASPVITQYQGTSGEYMDFRKDGKLYSFINNVYDTANYTYSEANFKLKAKSPKQKATFGNNQMHPCISLSNYHIIELSNYQIIKLTYCI